MKCLLIALAAVLMLQTATPAAIESKNNPHHHHAPQRVEGITIVDGSSDTWDGVLEETVHNFNMVMPRHGPRLTYQRGERLLCPEQKITKTCSSELGTNGPGGFTVAGLAYLSLDSYGGDIGLDDPFPATHVEKLRVACHEMMHVLTHIGDNYGAVADSCVWGWQSTPGAWDIQQLVAKFGGKPKRDEKHHKKHHGGHHGHHRKH